MSLEYIVQLYLLLWKYIFFIGYLKLAKMEGLFYVLRAFLLLL